MNFKFKEIIKDPALTSKRLPQNNNLANNLQKI